MDVTISKMRLVFVSLLLFIMGGIIHYVYYYDPAVAMVVSVSSDGRYAISTDLHRHAVLWDLTRQQSKTLDTDANIYSAYFIKHTHYLMWQHDSNNQVLIKDIHNNLISHFNPGFPTYGQLASSDLRYYVASNVNWDIYSLPLPGKTQSTAMKLIELQHYFSGAEFIGSGKLISFDIHDHLLSAAGLADTSEGVSAWNLENNKLRYTITKNEMKTFATISPDGKYLLSGDENNLNFIWLLNTGSLVFQLNSIRFGKFIKTGPKDTDFRWDNTGMIPVPSAYGDYVDATLSFKFIDLQGDYLRFTTYTPYAILYNVNDPKPKKYFNLGKYPYPSVDDYSRDQAIDTSPAANLLVMGKRDYSGIIVYKFNPQKQTLKKIWIS